MGKARASPRPSAARAVEYVGPDLGQEMRMRSIAKGCVQRVIRPQRKRQMLQQCHMAAPGPEFIGQENAASVMAD